MSYVLIALGIALVATAILFVAVAWILGGILETMSSARSWVSKAILNLLGRRSSNNDALIKAFNHDEVQEKIAKTKDKVSKFQDWHPHGIYVREPPSHVYQECLRERSPFPSQKIDITEVDGLVQTTQLYNFQHLLEKVRPPRDYPGTWSAPTAKTELPKLLKPLEVMPEEPSLNLKRYSGVLSRLNAIVDKAHEKELRLFEEGTKKAKALETEISELNTHIDIGNARANLLSKDVQATLDAKITDYQETYNNLCQTYRDAHEQEKARIDQILEEYEGGSPSGISEYVDLLLRELELPPAIPRSWEVQYSPDNKTLIIEHQFPDFANLAIVKLVQLKSGEKEKPANKGEGKTATQNMFPSLALRLAYEVISNDPNKWVDAIVINGWAEYFDKNTGQQKQAFCVSLFATADHIRELQLNRIDPVSAFSALKGTNAGSLYEITPIAPTLRINKEDSRFVDAKEVMGNLQIGSNLAAMDWEDFEHLIRELFEKVWGSDDAEVNVTQASRDKGVDAIIHDPDPIKGGKIVIQAKRYTNLVDVSAVRDLFGTVSNEGANKGILVTTSKYGKESYEFAKGKPLTLINGQELLGLLYQHGYTHRIDLEEAKRLYHEAQ